MTEIRPHSYKTFEAAFETEASWVKIESSYLVCEDDKAIPVEFQESMVREARERGAIMDVVRVGGGHSPFLGRIDEVVGWIEGCIVEQASLSSIFSARNNIFNFPNSLKHQLASPPPPSSQPSISSHLM